MRCSECPNNKDGMCLYYGLPVEEINECDFKEADNPYVRVAIEIGRLVSMKQAAYGDSFGKSGEVLKILYPNGVKPEQYTNFLAVTRVIDKLFRIATDQDAFGENPWIDVAGYGVVSATKQRMTRKEEMKNQAAPQNPIIFRVGEP